ncbi:putative FBD-associated F-box protein At5g56440 [Vigna radiata var. radiata]|uniref:FBD-associated F-box protein At5g56440 n=1 Tax=Vigna radiata var. radiata TaxID=3916 RepID=A0A1S3UA53_VIGRR|nr:putative FBD-associated F-box protein At5g56440 [Vigna radiata var. radiata]
MLPGLPEEIILQILSFVDAKTAVQTSVLNKRCRYLWASLPVINFDDASFQDAMSFEDFVDNFLSCRDTSTIVSNVNLKCHYNVVDSIIEHLIDTLSITTTVEVLSMFPDKLKDESSPFTRMQTFELICDKSSSFIMPKDDQNGKTNIVEDGLCEEVKRN